MSRLKNPEINSIFDEEENKRMEAEQKREDYLEELERQEEELERQKEEADKEKGREIQEKNKTILSIDPNYEEKLEGDRRSVFYDEHYDFPQDSYYVDVYEERPEGAYTGRLTDTVYQDGSSYTDWGCWASIPEHWSNKQAENYLEMRANGYKISEKLFDNYIKSDAKNFDVFLNIEKVRHRINKNTKEDKGSPVPPNNSIASIAAIKKRKETQKGG